MDYITKTIKIGFTMFVDGEEIESQYEDVDASIDFQIVDGNVEVVGAEVKKDELASQFNAMIETYGEQMIMENESGIREEIHDTAEAYEVNHQVDMDQERKVLGDDE
tara:strand:+ start:3988 stop:4308 length:321 start_codon:yes stop_codon:yes gene_type:complete